MSSIETEQPKVAEQERKKNALLRQYQAELTQSLATGDAGQDKLKQLVEVIRPADLAEMLQRLPEVDQDRILRIIDFRRGALVLKCLPPSEAAKMLDRIDQPRAGHFLNFLPIDHRAAIIDRVGASHREGVLNEMEKGSAEEVRQALSWPARTAGRLLQTRVIRLPPLTKVTDALIRIREQNLAMEKVTGVYVVDEKGVLVGMLSLRQLVVADPQSTLESAMTRELVTARPEDDQEIVARLISKYDFLSIPVIDVHGVFLGIVSIDDIVDVLQQEQTEDVLNQAGIAGSRIAAEPYLGIRLSKIVSTRIGWLLMLFVAETLTGTVLRHFEEELAKVVALSFFIPLLIGTGGNAGSQTVSSIIRALALGEVEPRDWWPVLKREGSAGFLLGCLLGIIAFVRALMWGTAMKVSIAVAISILAICTWANTVGALVPMVAQRFGLDPTVMSAPLITTLVDATGLFIYFSIAGLILGL